MSGIEKRAKRVLITVFWFLAFVGSANSPLLGFQDSGNRDTQQGAESAWEFKDVHGTTHRPFDRQNKNKQKAIVLVFISHDCPIANAFQPEIRSLERKFRSQNVSFFLIHSNPDLDQETANQHCKEYEIEANVVIDSSQEIAKRVNAKVTPEAFLISAKGKTLYRGRINDLYAGFGKKRSQPTTHDLRDAIEQHLGGEKIQTAETKPIGCFIFFEKKK